MADGMNTMGKGMSIRARQSVARTINMLAENILGQAQRDAPLGEGTLRGSGSVDPATQMKLEATVTFDLPYAATQHEHVEFVHPKGGKAKFLEDPIKQHAAEMEQVIGSAVRKAIELGLKGAR